MTLFAESIINSIKKIDTQNNTMQVEYRFVKTDKENEQIRTKAINQIVCKVIKRKLSQLTSEERMSDKTFIDKG